MGVVQSSKGVLTPVSGQLLSEPAIVCHLARATLKSTKTRWDDYLRNYDCIREDLERTIPGFDRYNQRVREPGGFYLPNGPRDGKFNTPDGKAHFNIATPETITLQPGEWMMMTIRSHDQFNTTIYGLNDRYRGIFNERRVIFLNAEDMREQSLAENDIVDIYNEYGGIHRIARRFVVVPYSIPRQCAATYYPETNVLVPIENTARQSNTPVSKLVLIRLRRSS
jgi:anaerobic selenocysteine-containing dehydrogenase